MSSCRIVAQELKLPIKKSVWAEYPNNFHVVEFGPHDDSVFVLFNAHYAICAFASDLSNRDEALVFSDNQQLFDAFSRLTEFRPISRDFLERAPRKESYPK